MNTTQSAALSGAAAALVLSATASAFTFDDIHYWVGEGTNRCAVVIDWSAYGVTKAWGYRWNGTATNMAEVVSRIAYDDPRLKMGMQRMTSSYVDFYFFGYDVNDCHPSWDLDNGVGSDPEAPALREDSVFYTAWWVFYGPMNDPAFPTTEQTSSRTAANDAIPKDDDWYVFSYGSPAYDADWNETPAVLAEPTAAESPYGFEVVASSTTAVGNYCDPKNVLGRPTMYMSGAWGGPVSPYNPAWQAGELFSLESYGDEQLEPGEPDGPGYVTIKFDHDVVDDPANPFGIDFIVFGNALGEGNSEVWYAQTTDPDKVSFSGNGDHEDALVEVSQDGRTWHAFSKGPFADGALPTLGLQYDRANPDPNLFAGNLYWGRPTRATYPVNPAVTFADFKGKTLAQVCQCYNGSAGGTGYDLKNVDLPADDAHLGRKWFRYVRISSRFVEDMGEGDSGYTAPDIDAVADVAPVSPYELWVEQNYTDWTTAWKTSVTGPEAVCANGRANAVNFVLGLQADGTPCVSDASAPSAETLAKLDFRIASFTPGEIFNAYTVVTAVPLAADCGIVVKSANDLTSRSWTSEAPLIDGSVRQADGTYVTTLRVTVRGKYSKLSFDPGL